jgi:hypothetical protein
MGDYASGTTLKPTVVNIEFDADLKLSHVGIGYRLILPSGRSHDGGFTWHSPEGGYAQAPKEQAERLQACMDALLEAAAKHEGVELRPSGVVTTYPPG